MGLKQFKKKKRVMIRWWLKTIQDWAYKMEKIVQLWLTEYKMIKAWIRHELINKKMLVFFRAETKKMDQILVPELSQKIDFIKKLSVISSARYLDCYFLSALKLTLKILKLNFPMFFIYYYITHVEGSIKD